MSIFDTDEAITCHFCHKKFCKGECLRGLPPRRKEKTMRVKYTYEITVKVDVNPGVPVDMDEVIAFIGQGPVSNANVPLSDLKDVIIFDRLMNFAPDDAITSTGIAIETLRLKEMYVPTLNKIYIIPKTLEEKQEEQEKKT